MGSSQYVFAKGYVDQKSPSWLSAHVEAFEFYGAVPAIVVPDNLKTGVEKSCRYEPETNLAYAELARHYGLAVLPARVRKPKDKAKVENAVQQVERWVMAPLRERTFFSLREANEALAEELSKLNARVMKGPGLSRKALFEAEDRPAMRPLPQARYSLSEWKRVKLGPDYHVEVEGHLYSVPHRMVGEVLDVRYNLSTVEVFQRGKRLAAHHRSLSRRGFTTLEDHMPERHRGQAEWTPERMSRWAASLGPNVALFAESLMKSRAHPEQAYRPLLGTLRLERQFGAARLDAACRRALTVGALSYKSLKSILDKGLDEVPTQPELPCLPAHENIRGGAFYSQGADVCAS
jgi:transposase